MPKQPNTFPLSRLGPINSLAEGTELGRSLLNAKNLMLRPAGGMKGPPTYDRLWAIGASGPVDYIYKGLPFTGYPGGIGATPTAIALNKTCAILISRQGKNALLFYDLVSSQERGFFYLGDDGSYTAGAYDFTAGTPTYEVLAVGLDSTARWYGTPVFTELLLGNGVDANAIVQVNRTAAPGKWRIAGSNAAPAAPFAALVDPVSPTLTAASWTIPGSAGTAPKRVGTASLTFTLKPEGFPGESGNGKFKVKISFLSTKLATDPITSTLIGQGTSDAPYEYTLVTGQANSGFNNSTDAIVNYVNSDPLVSSFLLASKSAANATKDTGNYGPTLLSGGVGLPSEEGFTNRTLTFYTRFWDPGNEDLGYEGVSSPISNAVVISALETKNVALLLPIETSSASARFPFIRIYMQIGESPNEEYLLLNPDNPTVKPVASPILLNSVTPVAANPLLTTPTLVNWLFFATEAYEVAVMNATTNDFELAFAGSPLPLNTPVIFNMVGPTVAPLGGITSNTVYFLVPQAGGKYKIKTSIDAAGTVDLVTPVTSATTDLMCTVVSPINLAVGEKISFTDLTGGLENITNLSLETPYFVKEATPYSVRLSLTLDGATISVAMLTSGTYAIGAVNVKQVDIKVLISTTTPILTAAEGGLMSADQNQPLPHTYHALVGTQLWRGGIRTQPTTLQVSKPAQADELVPEGSNRKATETVKLSDTQPGSARISAMWAEGTRLHIHTNSGIIVLASPNTDPTQLAEPPVLAGALNGNCLVQWEKNVLYYLGSDLRIYRQADDNLFTKLQASAVDDASQQYIRDRVDLTELGRRPERAFMFADTAAKMLWFFLPAKDGTLKGFAHDLMLDGLTGEFDYPKVYDLARMESNRPELLFGDEAGNLFVWNTEAQSDIGNAFPSTSTLTPYSTSAPVPDEWAGYGHVDYDHNGDGTPSRFYGAAETILQTGYFDLSTPERRKAFQALIFRTVRNSRGFVEVKLTGLGGDEVTFVYGDMGEVPRADHRADLMLCDSAISVQLRIISAQDKPWIIRDLSILWQSQGTI